MSKVDKVKKRNQMPTPSFWVAGVLWLLSLVFFMFFEVFQGEGRVLWLALVVAMLLADIVVSIIAAVVNKSLVLRAVLILFIILSVWQLGGVILSMLWSVGEL